MNLSPTQKYTYVYILSYCCFHSNPNSMANKAKSRRSLLSLSWQMVWMGTDQISLVGKHVNCASIFCWKLPLLHVSWQWCWWAGDRIWLCGRWVQAGAHRVWCWQPAAWWLVQWGEPTLYVLPVLHLRQHGCSQQLPQVGVVTVRGCCWRWRMIWSNQINLYHM